MTAPGSSANAIPGLDGTLARKPAAAAIGRVVRDFRKLALSTSASSTV